MERGKKERSEWAPHYLTLNQIMDAVVAEGKSPKWIEKNLKTPVLRVSSDGTASESGVSGISDYELALWKQNHRGDVVRVKELGKLGLQPVDQYVRFPGKYEDETLGANTAAAYAIGPNTITHKKYEEGFVSAQPSMKNALLHPKRVAAPYLQETLRENRRKRNYERRKKKTLIHEGLHKVYVNLSLFKPDTQVQYSSLDELERNDAAQNENLKRNETALKLLRERFSDPVEARERQTITETISYALGDTYSRKKIENLLLTAPNYEGTRTGHQSTDRARFASAANSVKSLQAMGYDEFETCKIAAPAKSIEELAKLVSTIKAREGYGTKERVRKAATEAFYQVRENIGDAWTRVKLKKKKIKQTLERNARIYSKLKDSTNQIPNENYLVNTAASRIDMGYSGKTIRDMLKSRGADPETAKRVVGLAREAKTLYGKHISKHDTRPDGKRAYTVIANTSESVKDYANQVDNWKNTYGWGLGNKARNAYREGLARVSDSIIVKPYSKLLVKRDAEAKVTAERKK